MTAPRYLGPIRPDRHPVTMGCSIAPVFQPHPPATGVPVLLLLEEAIAAVSGPRPLCQEQLPLDGHPTPTALRCDLPAGHHSEEHYDRATGRVWLPPDAEPRTRPGPAQLPYDRPWPGGPGA